MYMEPIIRSEASEAAASPGAARLAAGVAFLIAALALALPYWLLFGIWTGLALIGAAAGGALRIATGSAVYAAAILGSPSAARRS